jgi:hypothetical protein
MGTINAAFSVMSQALDADQSALNIVANNVANANTPGYTREVPNWQENDPFVVNGGLLWLRCYRDWRHVGARPSAYAAAGSAAAAGFGLRSTVVGIEYAAGSVHSRFRFHQF